MSRTHEFVLGDRTVEDHQELHAETASIVMDVTWINNGGADEQAFLKADDSLSQMSWRFSSV
jgi:hypothetical protein